MKTLLRIIMGLAVLFLLSGMSTQPAFGQANTQKAESEYSRPSISLFFATFPGDYNNQKAVESAKKIAFSDKYFNHNLNEMGIELNPGFKNLAFDAKKKR